MDFKKKSFEGCIADMMLKSGHFEFSSNTAESEVMDLTQQHQGKHPTDVHPFPKVLCMCLGTEWTFTLKHRS